MKVEMKIEPKIEPQEAALDSIDERNKGIVDLWVAHFVQHNNSYTTVEELAQGAYKADLFTGESIDSVRNHCLSVIVMNWEMFVLHTAEDRTDVAKLMEGIYREAANIPKSAPANAVRADYDIPGIASATQDVVTDSSPPELAESTSTKPSGS